MSEKQRDNRLSQYLAYGLVFGPGLGLLAGIVTPLSIPLGLAFGAGLGVVVGAAAASSRG